MPKTVNGLTFNEVDPLPCRNLPQLDPSQSPSFHEVNLPFTDSHLDHIVSVFGSGSTIRWYPTDDANGVIIRGPERPAPLTSLDSREFNVESRVDKKWKTIENWSPLTGKPPAILDNTRQLARFCRWPEYRKLMHEVLWRFEPVRSRWQNFASCGEHAWVYRNRSTGKHRLHVESCNLRCCPACRSFAQQKFIHKAEHAFGNIEPRFLKFCTFTLKHSDLDLRDQLAHLRSSLRRLRQRAVWKNCVKYGYAVIEVKWSRKTERWHPHVHCILKSHYIPHEVLKRNWAEVTGDSIIVDIRAVKSGNEAARYLAKYIGKPAPVHNLPNKIDRIREYYFALRGAKMVLVLGKPPVPPDEPVPDGFDPMSPDWECLGSVEHVTMCAETGEKWAVEALLNCDLPPPTIFSPDEIDVPFPVGDEAQFQALQPEFLGYEMVLLFD